MAENEVTVSKTADMDKYYEVLKKRDDQGDTPYNLRSCAYMDDFSKQKIIFCGKELSKCCQ